MSAGLYEITVNALLDRGTALSRTEWESAASRVGRERVPALLVELTDAALIGGDVLPRAVADAWSGPARPERRLDPEQWVELFGAAGYTVDGEPAPRPGVPVRLHGTGEGDVAGLAWTEDRAGAPGHTTLAPPEALLARVTAADGRVEHLVDPSLLGPVTAV
ncbi:hypothetical protein [Pseudonocardia sp. KRD291]|uniref:hypothetical protein n=1 Tax=Pseudonocardia sp. KRD291 TaxID=2792007 RepID=UPI001C49D31E|nr:hypothetical protein [Pseudonocardia sp. KRD291]MBW0103841.1 hypothetical protein [Pseudonocardia sp. KRD291]